MRQQQSPSSEFTRFVKEIEPRLSYAFFAAFGPEVGSEVTAEALAYAWENWSRVRRMDNPAGYLYRVGQSKARRFGLTADDLRGATGVVWMIDRSSGPASWEAATAVIIEDVGPAEVLLDGDDGALALVLSSANGGYETWRFVPGEAWSKVDPVLGSAIDITVWRGRPLVLTAEGAILELKGGSWVTVADSETFDSANGDPADPVRIEAGDIGVVVIGDREEVLPWSEGEPVPTAQVVWFSVDGSHWSSQEVSDLFGDIGAVDVLVTRYAGNREGPPGVFVAFGSSQDDGYPVTDPQWWAGQID